MTTYITITGFDNDATAKERADVTIGREYRVIDNVEGCDVDPFFIDDANEQNFGCDADNTVYVFTARSEEESA